MSALYIGNNQFLHHVQGRLSTIDTYGGYWEKHTIRRLRHVNAS
ncbi:NlpC/P60 family protein [Acinetobacter baumannii]